MIPDATFLHRRPRSPTLEWPGSGRLFGTLISGPPAVRATIAGWHRLLRAAGLAGAALLFPAVAAAHGSAAAPPSGADRSPDACGRSTRPSRCRSSRPRSAGCRRFEPSIGRTRRTRCRFGGPSAFLWGLVAIELALQSPIERYDTTLFSAHMIQHILLTLIAPPLIAAGAPITLLLRFSRPAFRRRWILPVLHSRACAPDAPVVVVAGLRGSACGEATSRRCSTRRWRSR